MKHFLFITALGMLIGSVVFLYLGLQRSKSSLAHTAVFLAAAVSCLSYYSMATGLGVRPTNMQQLTNNNHQGSEVDPPSPVPNVELMEELP